MDNNLIDDEGFEPFPTPLEMLRQHLVLLEGELEYASAEVRGCRRRIAVLVVQHMKDVGEIDQCKTELERIRWQLSHARLDASKVLTATMSYQYGEHSPPSRA